MWYFPLADAAESFSGVAEVSDTITSGSPSGRIVSDLTFRQRDLLTVVRPEKCNVCVESGKGWKHYALLGSRIFYHCAGSGPSRVYRDLFRVRGYCQDTLLCISGAVSGFAGKSRRAADLSKQNEGWNMDRPRKVTAAVCGLSCALGHGFSNGLACLRNRSACEADSSDTARARSEAHRPYR